VLLSPSSGASGFLRNQPRAHREADQGWNIKDVFILASLCISENLPAMSAGVFQPCRVRPAFRGRKVGRLLVVRGETAQSVDGFECETIGTLEAAILGGGHEPQLSLGTPSPAQLQRANSPIRACLKTRFGVPPLGGAAQKPPKGGTPNLPQRVSMVFFKQALRPLPKSPLSGMQTSLRQPATTEAPLRCWMRVTP
jgi:hypothetical protein